MDAVHGDVVRGEALAAEGTTLGRLLDLYFRQYTVDEVRHLESCWLVMPRFAVSA